MQNELRGYIWAFAVMTDVIIIDQVSKWLMIGTPSQTIIPGFFSLTYAENTGVAFSMPLQGLFLQIVTAVLIVVLGVAYVRTKAHTKPILNIGLALMMGGALGNAYDRFFRGFVIDFLSVGTFPIFNIADSAVTIGVFCILLYEWKKTA